jgi:hypothetical protein
MPYDPPQILERYASGDASYPNGQPLAPGAAQAWAAVSGSGAGVLGAARVADSARRVWRVEPRRDPGRGRIVVVSPVHGDNEPFRASADGYRRDTHLPIEAAEWTLLALLASGQEDGDGLADAELRDAAFRVVDRMVRAAQHQSLMGAADDDED